MIRTYQSIYVSSYRWIFRNFGQGKLPQIKSLFNVSFLLNAGPHQTFPVALFTANTSETPQVASAATTVFLAVVLPVLLVIQWLGGEDLVKVEQGV